MKKKINPRKLTLTVRISERDKREIEFKAKSRDMSLSEWAYGILNKFKNSYRHQDLRKKAQDSLQRVIKILGETHDEMKNKFEAADDDSLAKPTYMKLMMNMAVESLRLKILLRKLEEEEKRDSLGI